MGKAIVRPIDKGDTFRPVEHPGAEMANRKGCLFDERKRNDDRTKPAEDDARKSYARPAWAGWAFFCEDVRFSLTW